MGLPPFTTDDDRINDAYMHAIYPVQLVLVLFIVAFRTRNLTEAKASSKHRVNPVPFCYRVPHLVCCLALVAMYITIIFYDAVLEGQDVPWSTATTKAYYLAMDVCATLMWALCAGLVLAEQRHQKHTCRLLRLWWILNLVVASAFVGFELVELVPLPESEWGQGPGRWTLVRACGFFPAFLLGMIGCFEADTSHGPPAYLSSSAPSNYAAPLLLGSTQGGATMPAEEPAVPLSAEAHASFFSQLTFSYMSELLALGRGRALEHSDLFGLDDEDASAANEKLCARAAFPPPPSHPPPSRPPLPAASPCTYAHPPSPSLSYPLPARNPCAALSKPSPKVAPSCAAGTARTASTFGSRAHSSCSTRRALLPIRCSCTRS